MSKKFWEIEYKPCDKCKEGFVFSSDGLRMTKCSCKKNYEQDMNNIRLWLNSNLLTKDSSLKQYDFIKNYTLKSYKGPDIIGNLKKVTKFIQKFDEKYSGLHLFFSGDCGTQKTCIAKYIISELVKTKHNAYYILANDLVNKLLDAQRDAEAKEFITKLQTIDCLVIDEFDTDKIVIYESGYQTKFLLPWLKNRIEVIGKSTIFISNRKIDNLGKVFEGSIQDLIYRSVLDKTMIFQDKYLDYQDKIDISSIWED